MDRRDFLKVSAMAAASAAATKAVLAVDESPIDSKVLEQAGRGVTWNKAPCRFCGTGCHMQVGVSKGRIVAVTGDRLAPVNKGSLCVKGYSTGLILYGKDRLTTPLLKKDGKQVPISWDEALDIIAARVQKNPAGFGFYLSGQSTIPEGAAIMKFMKGGLGNNHVDPNARLCMASAVTGYISTYGVDEPSTCYDDLDNCDTVIFWGNNPAEMHPILFSRMVDRRSRGEELEIIDITTRHTRSSAFAQHALIFNPQSDLAIANGILHLLLENESYDKEFIEKFCNFRHDGEAGGLFGEEMSFEQFRKSLKEYTPDRVAEISGIAAKTIRWLASLFEDKKRKIVSLWCMGVNQHTRGTAMNRLIHAVHMLSGHFGTIGDGPQSLTGQPSACGTCREVGTLGHALPGGRIVANEKHRKQSEELWKVPAGRINPKPGYHTVAMWRAFSTPTDKGGDIDTIWVQVTNPGQSLPNTGELFWPSRKLDDKFLIVSDVYPTETTRAADLVLPAALWVEKNGVYGNSERRTQQWFKLVEPPGEARDDAWAVIAVARRLYDTGVEGMKDKDGNFIFQVKDDAGNEVPVWDWKHYYDVNVDKHLFEEYRGFTTMKHKNIAPYDEYVAARGLRWPVVEKDGKWVETRYRFIEGEDPFVEKGKGVQFYHSKTEDDKAFIWFQPYVAPPEVPDGEYPFWLCTGRVVEHWHTGTMTMRVPQLRRAMPQAYVELNAKDASRLGISNGDAVLLETRRGSLTLPAWVEGRAAPAEGSVFVPFFDERLLINGLTLDAHCPVSKEPDYKKCAVRVRRA